MRQDVFDRVVANIYDAASGRMPWNAAMGPLVDVFKLWGVQTLGIDKRTGTLMFSHETGPAPPQATIDYIRKYHSLNPRVAPSLALKVGEWLHDHEWFDDAYVARSPFYQEFLIPHGGRYLSGTKIIEDEHSLVLLGAMRGFGSRPLDANEMEVLERLRLHLTHAMEIYLHLRKAYAENNAARQLLNRFHYPMLLVDDHCGIRFHNDIAKASIANSPYFVERGGALRCRDPANDVRLMLALRELKLSDLGSPGTLPTRKFVRIEAIGHAAPAAIFAVAIRPQAAMGAFGHLPLALLILHEPGRDSALDPFIVGEMFDLTPAEARVAVALTKGLAPKQIASLTGISVATIRSQMKSIFLKTGATRQADLVARIMTLPAV